MASLEFDKEEYIVDTLNRVFRAPKFQGWGIDQSIDYICYRLLQNGQELCERSNNKNYPEYKSIYQKNGDDKNVVYPDNLKKKEYLKKSFTALTDDETTDLRSCFGESFSRSSLKLRNGFLRSNNSKTQIIRRVPKVSTFNFICLFLQVETGKEEFFIKENRQDWRISCYEIIKKEAENQLLQIDVSKLRVEIKELLNEDWYNIIFIDEGTVDARSRKFGISNFMYDDGFLTLEFASLNDSEVRSGVFEVVAKVHGAYYLVERNPVWGYAIMIRRVDNSSTEFSVHYLGNHQTRFMPLCGTGLAIKSEELIDPKRNVRDFNEFVYKDSGKQIDLGMVEKLKLASWKLRHLGNPIVEYDDIDEFKFYEWKGALEANNERFTIEFLTSIYSRFSEIIIEASFVSENRQLRLVTENGFYDKQKGYLVGQLYEIKEEKEGVSSGILIEIEINEWLDGARVQIMTDWFKNDNRENQNTQISFTFEIE